MPMTRQEILATLDRPTRTVEIPEWGGTFQIAALPFADTEYQRYIRPDRAIDQRTYDQLAAALLTAVNGIAEAADADDETRAAAAGIIESTLETLRQRIVNAEEILRRRIVANVIVSTFTEDGKRLFKWSDAPKVAAKNFRLLAELSSAINDLTADATTTLDEAKNS